MTAKGWIGIVVPEQLASRLNAIRGPHEPFHSAIKLLVDEHDKITGGLKK